MYAAKRPLPRPAIFLFIIASYLLVACGARGTNTNWPGLSTDGKRVYVAYGAEVIAYDVEAQEQVWSFPEEPKATLPFYAAPSVQDGRIILGDYGAAGGMFSPQKIVTIYALQNAQQGTPGTLWSDSKLATGSIVAPPLQIGDQVFIGTADNEILALDAETGELLWEFTTGHSIWAQPAYKDGVLFVTSLDKAVHALEADSGDVLWRTELGGAIASHPIVDTGFVYVASFDNRLHALDVGTGEERWAAAAEDWIWGAPALANDVVYFADIQGNVYAVRADTGAEVWRQQTIGPVQTSPVVVGDVVYIASEGEGDDEDTRQGVLTAYTAADGEQRWQKNTPASLYTTPIVVDDLIVVALQSDSALLIAFDLKTGERQWDFTPAEKS